MNTMGYYAEGVGALFREFKQATLIRSAKTPAVKNDLQRLGVANFVHRDGLCDALSVVYLAFLRDKVPFAELSKAAGLAYVDKLQGILMSPNGGAGAIVPARMELAYSVVSFVAESVAGPWSIPYTGMSDFIAGEAGYYHISLPNHACAAQTILDGRVKFFDPNYGDAMFENKTKFGHFLYSFLADRKIVSSYQLEGDGAAAIRVQVKSRGR